jgi:alpha-tubulin suppressor-like RCC1 family protein
MTVGGLHACGIRSDGTVACWGTGTTNAGALHRGQANAPGGVFTELGAGGFHTCGLKADGTVECWGAGATSDPSTGLDYGQAIPPVGIFTQLSAGGYHTCGLKPDSTVECWGAGTRRTGGVHDGQSVPPAATFIQISAGETHTCGVQTDGTAVCWGDNASEQATPPAGTFAQVSAGFLHSCGVRTDGTVECWGGDDNGAATPAAGTFVAVSTGHQRTCGVKTDGNVVCWGGVGTATPPSGTHGLPGVSAGGGHTCAVTGDGTLSCWGSASDGKTTPPNGSFSQVDAGFFHSCGLRTDGTVTCWGGISQFGELAAPSETFRQVSAGGNHSCAVRTDGTVACWGAGTTNTGSNLSFGQSMPPAGTFVQVGTGIQHSCGLKTDGTVTCWGSGKTNTGSDPDFGQAIDPSGTFKQISLGGHRSCGVKTDGIITCWGWGTTNDPSIGDYGQAIAPSGTYNQVSAGAEHTCGLRTDGTIACWGRNLDGEANPPPAATFVQVSAGSYYTCAVRSDGKVACWGFDSDGRATPPPALLPNVATLTILTLTPATQQYSDKVTLTASTFPAAATGTIQFKKSVDGGATFVDLGIPVTVPGASLADHQIHEAAGTGVQFKAVFTPIGNYTGSTSDAKALTVTKESATVGYASTNVAALQVAAPGGSLAANALSLAITVKETEPDLAAATQGIGTIENAGLKVVLAPVAGGSEVELTCIASAVTGTGYAATRPYSCTNSATVSVNTYEVVTTVTGNYYTGSYSDAFTVYDPSLGFATGGGSFVLGGDKVNFGFTMKYNKGGSNLQGNLIAVRHHPDGTVSRLKSNALGGLALGEDVTVPMGWASFTGKANYTTWDAAANGGAGAYVTVGNQSFAVYAEDRDNPGTGPDKVWLGAVGNLAMDGTLATAKTKTAALTGGGIAVPHKGGKK